MTILGIIMNKISTHIVNGLKVAVPFIVIFSVSYALHTNWILPKWISDYALWLVVPVLTAFIAHSIVDKFLLIPGFILGVFANTMDIGRTIFTHEKPRRKLDAGTFGTMGIGLPAVIAAQTCNPELWTVAVMGDSAFGFSAMECETLTRYKMGAVIFIINNNGIYSGTEALEGEPN